MMMGRRTRPEVFQDFCEETTAHAFLRIGDPQRKWWARGFWTIVLLAFTAIFVWQTQLLIVKYLQYETDTTTTVTSEDSLVFPMVVLCNVNPFQKDRIPIGSDLLKYITLAERIHNMSYKSEMQELCRQHNDTVAQLFCDGMMESNQNNQTSTDHPASQPGTDTDHPASQPGTDGPSIDPDDPSWNETDPTEDHPPRPQGPPKKRLSILDMENRALQQIGTIGAKMRGSYDNATQPEDDLIQDCLFRENPCESMFGGWHPWYGVCYKINTNGNFTSCRSGPMQGLSLELHVNVSQYLPSTFTVGVRVALYSPFRAASFPEIDGFFVPVGMATSVGIMQTETTRLSSPYGKCIKGSTGQESIPGYNYKGNYTLNGCLASCLQRQIVEKCGCWYFAYAPIEQYNGRNISLCEHPDSLDCALAEERKPHDPTCQCYPPCSEMEFKLTISHSFWATPQAAKCPFNAPQCKDSVEYARQNLLKLVIYYDSMTKYSYVQSAAYPALSLVSDFGGQLGLWLGGSFCTMFELLSFGLSMITTCLGCTHRDVEKHEKDEPSNGKGKNGNNVDLESVYCTGPSRSIPAVYAWNVPRPSCAYHQQFSYYP